MHQNKILVTATYHYQTLRYNMISISSVTTFHCNIFLIILSCWAPPQYRMRRGGRIVSRRPQPIRHKNWFQTRRRGSVVFVVGIGQNQRRVSLIRGGASTYRGGQQFRQVMETAGPAAWRAWACRAVYARWSDDDMTCNNKHHDGIYLSYFCA